MKKKQVVSGLLATVMIANIALVDMGPVQAAENLNLAKGCNVTASSYEVSDQIDTSPAKAVDGDMATRTPFHFCWRAEPKCRQELH